MVDKLEPVQINYWFRNYKTLRRVKRGQSSDVGIESGNNKEDNRHVGGVR